MKAEHVANAFLIPRGVARILAAGQPGLRRSIAPFMSDQQQRLVSQQRTYDLQETLQKAQPPPTRVHPQLRQRALTSDGASQADAKPRQILYSGLSDAERATQRGAQRRDAAHAPLQQRRAPQRRDDDDDFELTSYANGCCICWVSDHHSPIECRIACSIM